MQWRAIRRREVEWAVRNVWGQGVQSVIGLRPPPTFQAVYLDGRVLSNPAIAAADLCDKRLILQRDVRVRLTALP